MSSILTPTEAIHLDQAELDDSKYQVEDLSSPIKLEMNYGELREEDTAKNIYARLLRKLTKRSSINISSLKPIILSEEHGRSFVFDAIEGQAVWSDKYGNPFGSVDYKGATMGTLSARHGKPTLTSFDVVGLHEGGYNHRMQQASSILRSHNIPTERITGVAKLLEVIYEGNRMDIDTFKAHLWEQNEKWQSDSGFRRMINSDFHVIRRENPTGKRVLDLEKIYSKKDLELFIQPLFRWLNVLRRYSPDSPIIKMLPDHPLAASRQDDLEVYFDKYLPFQIGSNLARIHEETGLCLEFTHPQNILLTGNYIDLDSARGEALGDSPITPTEKINDLEITLRGLALTMSSINKHDLYQSSNPGFIAPLARILGAYIITSPTFSNMNNQEIDHYFARNSFYGNLLRKYDQSGNEKENADKVFAEIDRYRTTR